MVDIGWESSTYLHLGASTGSVRLRIHDPGHRLGCFHWDLVRLWYPRYGSSTSASIGFVSSFLLLYPGALRVASICEVSGARVSVSLDWAASFDSCEIDWPPRRTCCPRILCKRSRKLNWHVEFDHVLTGGSDKPNFWCILLNDRTSMC